MGGDLLTSPDLTCSVSRHMLTFAAPSSSPAWAVSRMPFAFAFMYTSRKREVEPAPNGPVPLSWSTARILSLKGDVR